MRRHQTCPPRSRTVRKSAQHCFVSPAFSISSTMSQQQETDGLPSLRFAGSASRHCPVKPHSTLPLRVPGRTPANSWALSSLNWNSLFLQSQKTNCRSCNCTNIVPKTPLQNSTLPRTVENGHRNACCRSELHQSRTSETPSSAFKDQICQSFAYSGHFWNPKSLLWQTTSGTAVT